MSSEDESSETSSSGTSKAIESSSDSEEEICSNTSQEPEVNIYDNIPLNIPEPEHVNIPVYSPPASSMKKKKPIIKLGLQKIA